MPPGPVLQTDTSGTLVDKEFVRQIADRERESAAEAKLRRFSTAVAAAEVDFLAPGQHCSFYQLVLTLLNHFETTLRHFRILAALLIASSRKTRSTKCPKLGST